MKKSAVPFEHRNSRSYDCGGRYNAEHCSNPSSGSNACLSVVSDTSTLTGGCGGIPKNKVPITQSLSTPPGSVTGNGNSLNISPSSQTVLSCLAATPFSPVLLKSVSAPVLPSFKPQDQRISKPSGCSIISADEFDKMLNILDSEDLLIFDVRPFNDYSKSSVKRSIHVCLPSTLLRRKSFTFKKLIDNLPADVQFVIRERKLKNANLRIIIYDNIANQREDSVSLACNGIASKIADYYSGNAPFRSVSILGSGFKEFEDLFPEHTASQSDSPISQASYSAIDLQVEVPSDMLPQGLVPPPPISMDSPISSSSPISALSRFKLPPTDNTPCCAFKIAQNEQLMNLESYLSAVDIKEENEQHSMHTFKFPQRKQNQAKGVNKSKLRFQTRYEELQSLYGRTQIDSVIPIWFQRLMKRSKIDFISQFQKLDFLERKRLNKGLNTHRVSYSIGFFPRNDNDGIRAPNGAQCRSYSQPNCLQSHQNITKHLCAIESDDEEDEIITISSGVELGIKNRYKDIFPYEHSRVILKKNTNSDSSSTFKTGYSNDSWESYINANYLDVPELLSSTNTNHFDSRKVRYIATQAPLASTVHDFFTCILNDNVPLVVTLTDSFENGSEKCFPYWEPGNYNGITIEVSEVSSLSTPTMSDSGAKIYIRRLRLTYDDNKTFETLQLHIKDWPDLGTLIDPTQIIQAINLKDFVIDGLFNKEVYANDYVPTILVHCSAGCGRTGTWCTVDSIISNMHAFDILRERFDSENASPNETKPFDPIVWIINIFRKQRISIVQNVNQFLFIYDCLLYYFTLKLNDKCRVPDKPPFEGCSMENLLNQIKELKILQSIINVKTFEKLPFSA